MAKSKDGAEATDQKLNAFLSELTKIAPAYEWSVDHYGGIRGEHPDSECQFCPITAMAHQVGDPVLAPEVHAAADRLGLASIATDLVDAIDYRNKSVKLRARILQAVRLSE
jgi:hypothetical protein